MNYTYALKLYEKYLFSVLPELACPRQSFAILWIEENWEVDTLIFYFQTYANFLKSEELNFSEVLRMKFNKLKNHFV